MIRETHKVYENQSVIDHYNKGYERGSMCPPNPGDCYQCQSRRLYDKYNKRCEVSQLLDDHFGVNNISSVPAERTQTPEEALELSIWSPYNGLDLSVLRFCWKTICI